MFLFEKWYKQNGDFMTQVSDLSLWASPSAAWHLILQPKSLATLAMVLDNTTQYGMSTDEPWERHSMEAELTQLCPKRHHSALNKRFLFQALNFALEFRYK